jgi:hypothetical protein
MSDGRDVEPDPLAAAEVSEGALGEVGPVVSDDAMQVSIPQDDIPDEGDGCGAVQLLDGLRLNPLGELVHSYQEVCHAAARHLEWPDHV